MIFGYSFAQVRKAFVAILGFIVTGFTLALEAGDILPDSWAKWVILGVSLAATYGVYATPNDRLDVVHTRRQGPRPTGKAL
jgi:hypothetical protein